MPLRPRLTRAAAVAVAITMAGCATMHPNADVPPHPVTITVVNNLSLPTELTLYAVTTGGSFHLLGNVAPSDSTSVQMTPRSFSEPYRLLVQGMQHGARLWSDEFTVRDATTGEIRWQLVPNILQFFNMPEDSTAPPAKP